MGKLQEGILHLDLILHHSLLDIIEILSIRGSEVDRGITKERRSLGKSINQIAKVTEVLDNLCQCRSLTSTRAACQGDACNIFVHS